MRPQASSVLHVLSASHWLLQCKRSCGFTAISDINGDIYRIRTGETCHAALFMKATNAELKSMYAHKQRPIYQVGRANYLIRRDIVFKPCISFCNIKTHVAEAAEMVSMSMNALANFGRGCCIRPPWGYQHATPLLVCHSSSSVRAETEAAGSDAFGQLGRLMKVI